MRISGKILFILILLTTGSCITQFVPESADFKNFLVVEGLITDQDRSNTILLSRSASVNSKFKKRPVTGGIISISDDLGHNFNLIEKKPGKYITDSLNFRGVVGRKYTLKIIAEGFNYMSDPMEMKAVPPIDSIYSEKTFIKPFDSGQILPGYQVSVSTFDSTGKTGYYRWTYTESWEFHLPYNHPSVINRVCWKYDNSRTVLITTTKSLSEDRVIKFPVDLITTETDRLEIKYSLLLKQYSLNEEEFLYWEKIQKITEETGGLYDVVPISVKSNIKCIDDPAREVLGYFSVSAVSEKRLFIYPDNERFPDFYKDCPNDTIPSSRQDPRIGISAFIIMEISNNGNLFYVLTYNKSCHDCSLSGSKVKPDFWDDGKNISIPRDNFDFSK